MRRLLGVLVLTFLWCPTAQAQWSPQNTQVMVLGTPHLWQMPENAVNDHVPAIRKRLLEFAPDMIALEWLHPSIAPETTSNYSKLGDKKTLAQLWDINASKLEALKSATRSSLSKSPSDPTEERILLGKLYYLEGDVLNAGYQWWLAAQSGSEGEELRNLTNKDFEGHELEVFGFHLARELDIESVTPFDYQGADADWNHAFGELVENVARVAIPDTQSTDQKLLKKKRADFLEQMNSDPSRWLREHGKNPKIQSFAKVLRSITEIKGSLDDFGKKNDYGLIGHMQSPPFANGQKQLYYDQLFNVSLAGLGRQLVVNYERRNEKMVNFVIRDAKRQNAKRILIIVGVGHKLFLDAIFRRQGFQLIDSNEFLKSGWKHP